MIKAERISQFYGRQPIFSDVSFAIAPNEVCAIVGQNGAGKSTLLQTLLGLLPLKHGKVTICRYDIAKTDKWKKHVSYLPEHFQLYPQLTVKENMEFFASLEKAGKDKVERVLTQMGLIHHKGKKVRQLSKGMLQRLGLGLALLRDADLIFLDEPTSGIDPFGRREIIQSIKEMKSLGKTILFSSHHLHEVREVATHVLFLHEGKASKWPVEEFRLEMMNP